MTLSRCRAVKALESKRPTVHDLAAPPNPGQAPHLEDPMTLYRTQLASSWLARGLAAGAALLLALAATPAESKGKAAPKPEAPAEDQINEAEVLGEAHIAMKLPFVKFQIDDKKEWDNHEYSDGAKTLVIKGIERSEDHTVVLTPREPGYEPVTLTLKGGEFKRAVVKTKGRTQTITFKAFYKADFKKVEAPKAP